MWTWIRRIAGLLFGDTWTYMNGIFSLAGIQEILNEKNDFDDRLNEIRELSGVNFENILGLETIDILSLTQEEIKIFADILKNGREQEIQRAESWIRFDKSTYFALADRLPPDVWERYPAIPQSREILSWIAELPEETMEKILELTPEEALREKDKGIAF